METPDLSHLPSEAYNSVYEPAEDSFLLLDALEKHLPELHTLNPCLCLEVGSGSGVISVALAKHLNKSCYFIATDINPEAVKTTKATAKHNKVHVEAVRCDLLGSLLTRLRSTVDILVFNPPYVVTPSSEVGSEGIEASWAGGKDGREVTDRLLPSVAGVLSDKGRFYLVTVKENNVSDLCEVLEAAGLRSETVLSRRAGREHLSVLCFTKVR